MLRKSLPGAVKLALDFSLAVSLALQPQNVAVVDHSTPSLMRIVTQCMCTISIIEGGALHRDGGAETPCRWCYFSVQEVLRRRNSHIYRPLLLKIVTLSSAIPNYKGSGSLP